MKRPWALTVVAWLMIAAGVGGMAMGVWRGVDWDLVWIALFGITGIACGAFLLMRKNWARWLTLAWLASHIVIGALNSAKEAAAHAVIFALIAYLMFRSDVREYFRGAARAG